MFYLLCTSLQKGWGRDLWFLWWSKKAKIFCSPVAKKIGPASFPIWIEIVCIFATSTTQAWTHDDLLLFVQTTKNWWLFVDPHYPCFCMYVCTDRWCDYVQALGVECLCNNNNNNNNHNNDDGFASICSILWTDIASSNFTMMRARSSSRCTSPTTTTTTKKQQSPPNKSHKSKCFVIKKQVFSLGAINEQKNFLASWNERNHLGRLLGASCRISKWKPLRRWEKKCMIMLCQFNTSPPALPPPSPPSLQLWAFWYISTYLPLSIILRKILPK
jgi:hypothetical protein